MDFHQLVSMRWKAQGCGGHTQKVKLATCSCSHWPEGLLPCLSVCFFVIQDVWPLPKSDNAVWGEKLHCDNVSDTYFPKAKHSNFTDDPLETWRVSGNWTSIFGSYSPITTAQRIKANHISQNTKQGHEVSCNSYWMWELWCEWHWQRASVRVDAIYNSIWLSGWMSLDYISASAQFSSGTHKWSWWGLVCVASSLLCVCLLAFLSVQTTFLVM